MIIAVAGVVLLGCLAAFQTLLVAGAPLGRYAWGGGHVVLPTHLRVGSVVSIGLYAVFALLVLQAADAIDVLPSGPADVGTAR